MKITTPAVLSLIIALSACGGTATDMTAMSTPIFDGRLAEYQDSFDRAGALPRIMPPMLGTASYSGPILFTLNNTDQETVRDVANIGVSFAANQFAGNTVNFVNARDKDVSGALAFSNGLFDAQGFGNATVSGRLGLDVGDLDISGRSVMELRGTAGTSGEFANGQITGSAALADGSAFQIAAAPFALERQ